jgi:hydroxymethylbilane synthase
MRIRIGTRGSQLALWQARTVSERLSAEDLVCETVIIKTSGDRLGEAPLSEAGGKRLFVKEIEDALLDGRVDIAVHSAKDMPVDATESSADLAIAAVLPREEPWDALVLPTSPLKPAGLAPETLEQIISRLGPDATIGTSSIRRIAQLRRLFHLATFAPIRGNLDTRLRKLDDGQYAALVLAAAGLKRLGAGNRISGRLPIDACVPAPGQGAIAVQIRANDEAIRARLATINDPETHAALVAERAVVTALNGGCQTPIGALAQPLNTDTLDLRAIVISTDGTRVLRAQATGPLVDPDTLGRGVGEALLSQGAAEILATP